MALGAGEDGAAGQAILELLPSPAGMIIHFQPTAEDARLRSHQLSKYCARFAGGSPYNVYWYILLPASTVLLAVVDESFPHAILAFLLFSGVALLTTRWHRARWNSRVFSEKNLAGVLLPCQVELLPDRLVISNASFVSHLFWHSFHVLRETPRHFQLFFSPISFIAVPKAAFASEVELQEFRTFIKSHTTRESVPSVSS